MAEIVQTLFLLLEGQKAVQELPLTLQTECNGSYGTRLAFSCQEHSTWWRISNGGLFQSSMVKTVQNSICYEFVQFKMNVFRIMVDCSC